MLGNLTTGTSSAVFGSPRQSESFDAQLFFKSGFMQINVIPGPPIETCDHYRFIIDGNNCADPVSSD